METLNKLEKLSSEKGTFKGGFATLSEKQLLRLKGGSGGGSNGNGNCNCNCSC